MIEIPPLNAEAVVWSRPEDQRAGHPMVVLLHGYGANERDLLPVVPHLPDGFVYAAVRAPLTPPFPAPGFSWYPIEGLYARDNAATTASALRFLAWLDEHLDPEAPVGLLGFSQGGAISLQALRLRPERFAFAVNLSGYVTPGEVPSDDELRAAQPPVFWGRGSADTVIPGELIMHTASWLPDVVSLSGRVYDGLAHSVSAEEVADVSAFLETQLAALD